MKGRILSLFVALTMVIGLYVPMTAKAALNDIQAKRDHITFRQGKPVHQRCISRRA